jgi:Flp pilus assembly secretin CpaC
MGRRPRKMALPMPSQFPMPSRLHVMHLIGGAALACSLMSVQAVAAEFKVEINEQKALHLPAPIATVMVGNPAIADVSVESPQTVYVLGRGYGKTNFIALDASGKQVAQYDLAVVAQSGGVVTLLRGSGQSTYSCTPRCEPVVNPGDTSDSFSAALSQTTAASGVASGAASGAGGNSSGNSAGQMN